MVGRELIAETDENGRLLWVWIKEKGTRHARPVRDIVEDRTFLEEATCFGASCGSFQKWFDEHAGASKLGL
jgi:hypothetical protein